MPRLRQRNRRRMELARRLMAWTRLSEPGYRSFLLQMLLGALLILLFWLLDAIIDFAFFDSGNFFHFLMEPDSHELADFSLVVFLVCCLLLYSRHSHRVETKLEAALQDALQKAEAERAKFVGIVEAMGDAISIQDRDLNVVYQNRAHQEMAGGSHIGRRCYQAYRNREDVCPGCHVLEAFKDGKVHRVELSPPATRDGRHIEVISSVLTQPDGKPPLGIEVLRDITSRILAEKEAAELNAALVRQAGELQQVNRELEAFCLAISHDLRAPLTRIYSSAQELQGYARLLDDNGRFFVNLVNDGCVQMEEMIDALMVLCRVTEMEIFSAPVDLSSMVQELAGQLQMAAPGRKVRLEIMPEVVVQGDAKLLRIALENLVSNAWKYTSRATEPAITLGNFASEEGENVIFVRDNGAGFDSSRSEELFKPFRRLHSSREFPGTGLGLATVRRIIRRHNGRIWGEGSPGCGATFYFTIRG